MILLDPCIPFIDDKVINSNMSRSFGTDLSREGDRAGENQPNYTYATIIVMIDEIGT